MVDSIVFRVEDLDKHSDLLAYLHKTELEGRATRRKYLREPLDPLKEIDFQRYHVDMADGYHVTEGYSAFLRSSHYNVAYYINFQQSFIEFNLSLPKYVFGTNLLQLVPHFFEKHFEKYQEIDYSKLSLHHFMVFKGAFNWFLNREFIELIPDKSDMRIMRLDLCYNLVFNTQDDISHYLVYLRQVKKKFFRTSGSRCITNYHTGLHFPGETHTVKVYHKGSEFKAPTKYGPSNYSQVKKKRGKDVADKTLELANRVLRYEVSFKDSYLSDLWLRYLAPDFIRTARKYHTKCSAHGYLMVDGSKVAPYDLPPVYKKIVRAGQFLDGRKVKFYFSGKKDKSYGIDNYREFHFRTVFRLEMFELLMKKFVKVMDQFFVGDYSNINSMSKKLEEMEINKKASKILGRRKGAFKDGYNPRTIRMFVDLLRTNSWDEIRALNFVSDSTFYHYKKFFKEHGLREVNSQSSYGLSLNYANYYELIAKDFERIAVRNRLPFTY